MLSGFHIAASNTESALLAFAAAGLALAPPPSSDINALPKMATFDLGAPSARCPRSRPLRLRIPLQRSQLADGSGLQNRFEGYSLIESVTWENSRVAEESTFDLSRFKSAQAPVYETALAELKAGRKRSHWMWYIFPQIEGLGYSSTSKLYAIRGEDETRRYLADPMLGARLWECAAAVLAVRGRSALDIFGTPDDVKLKSSMTLFARVDAPGSVFSRVLEAYFGGVQDEETLRRLDPL